MSTDVLFSQVVQLMQGTSFIDESNYGKIFYNRGVTIGMPSCDSRPYLYFSQDTSQPVVYTPVTAECIIAANIDFEIDLDFVLMSSSAGCSLWSNLDGSGNGLLLSIDAYNRLHLTLIVNGSIKINYTYSVKLAINTVYTVTFGRTNGNFELLVNGVLASFGLTNAYYAGAIPNGTNIYIGSDASITSIYGFIRRYRYTVGGMRYTASFTPSYDAYPSASSNSDVVISSISSQLVKANQSNTLTLVTANAVSLKCIISDLNGNALTLTNSLAYNSLTQWTFTLTPPSYNGRLLVSFTAYDQANYLGNSYTKRFVLINSTNSSLTDVENFIYNIGALSSWVDFTDIGTLTASSGHITKVIDKATGDYVSSNNASLNSYSINAFNNYNGLSFTSAANSAFSYNTSITLNTAFTVILGLYYTGTQVGQGAGGFYLNSTGDGSGYGLQLTATSTGVDYIDINMFDSVNTLINAMDKFAPAGKYILGLSGDGINPPSLIINQVSYPITNPKLLSNALTIAKFGCIDSNHTSMLTISSILIYNQRLTDAYINLIMGLLNQSWLVYAAIPIIEPPLYSTGVAGEKYKSNITILNATSVSLVASAGTGWVITNTSGNTYAISGYMPDIIETITFTITARNAVNTAIATYPISVTTDSTTPVIHMPDVLACDVNSSFYANVVLENTTGASVVITGGSGWVIKNVSGNIWSITGYAGDIAGTYTMTIKAINSASGSALEASYHLRIIALNYLPQLYQIYTDTNSNRNTNLINTPESFYINIENGPEAAIVSPIYSPFRLSGMVIQYNNYGEWNNLVLGTDYVGYDKLTEISAVTGIDFYKSVRIIDFKRSGEYRFVSYITLGSAQHDNYKQFIIDAAEHIVNERTLNTAVISNNPNTLPVEDYQVDFSTSLNWGVLKTVVDGILTSLVSANANGDTPAIVSHGANLSFPHVYAKNDRYIGLGNVQNYPPVNDASFAAGSNSAYMTPAYAFRLNSASGTPQATITVPGISVALSSPVLTDATIATKALTYQGLVNMIMNGFAPWTLLYSNARPAQITPWPPTFPCYFKGYKLSNMTDMFNAIEFYYQIENINYRLDTGVAYLPMDISVYAIKLDSSASYATVSGFNPLSPIGLPMNKLV